MDDKGLRNEIFDSRIFSLIVLLLFLLCITNFVSAAIPVPPTSVGILNNETKDVSALNGSLMNTSGGYLTTINISTITQNAHWKGIVGYLTGKFSLDDASGSLLYDWSLASISGEVYATRNSSSISWTNVSCANTSIIENENIAMNHTNRYDNITATFRNGNNHTSFTVGTIVLSANQCNYTLNSYVNNVSSNRFSEVALNSFNTIIYASILENRVTGFDGNAYDFQMIVPEKGLSGFTGATPYYLYVKIN